MTPSRLMAVDDKPSDQPYARWQVVDDPHGGRFIVLRVDGKDPAGHWVYRVVRDFTRPLEPCAYSSTSTNDERLKRYELNYVVHKPHVELKSSISSAPVRVCGRTGGTSSTSTAAQSSG